MRRYSLKTNTLWTIFFKAHSCIVEFPSWEIACSQAIQYSSAHVSPDLLSLYVQSLLVLLTHCKWLIQSRELYLTLFVEQVLLCDIGLPDSSFNDMHCWIEVAIATATTPCWINKSIVFIVSFKLFGICKAKGYIILSIAKLFIRMTLSKIRIS